MKHYIIPIFIPHYGCQHQCVFCNQQKITGVVTPVTPEQISSIISEHLARITEPRHIEVAFYGGSFTALPLHIQKKLLAPAYAALQHKRIHAIRLSTRPDAITTEIVESIAELGVSIIELGAQSLDHEVLQAAQRGHQVEAVFEAVKIIKARGITCGLQLMLGLPKETWTILTKVASRLIVIAPDFIRIYPTLVIADTYLASLYQQGLYEPLTLLEAVKRAAFLKLLCLQHDIKVIRTGLQATEELGRAEVVLAGPYHPSFGEMVDSYLFNCMILHFFEVIGKADNEIIIHHHPRDHSKLRGMGNRNIEKWRILYPQVKFNMLPDGQQLDELVIEKDQTKYVINKTMLFYI